ncbi:MAG: membrane protein insertase YidC, partial [Gammaproteobacteria bacterium]|nr:membrane protein insertase YidC [Gammaproteobacteria bacterium]
IRRVYLLNYPVEQKVPNNPYPLMNDQLPQLFIAQSGLLSKQSAPDHHAVYSVSGSEFVMASGDNTLVVPMVWKSADGIVVTKTYTFHRDSYLITVDHKVSNTSATDWAGRLYRQFQRNEYDEPGKSRLLYTFTGGAVSSAEKPYEKIEFSEMGDWKPEQSYIKGGWVSMMQHYFVSAWLPKADEVNHFFSKNLNDTRYILGMMGTDVTVAAGSDSTFASRIYIGPKEQSRIESLADNLKLTVDYGWLTFIAQPLFWVLEKLHSFVGNWGWSIILLTVLIKLVFYKLSAASYRSMGNMRKIAPKFQAIRDRYGDDRQRLSQATMELYKKEKVNPLSGCWPMLVQIPVFIALYWMLLESVELRQADFILWIEDLSAKDPYYVLPLLMGASMYVQQKLSANPSLDPLQQKIMQFLPIIFTLFFMLFPAGLVLYWVVNNILSITQQWYVIRKIEKAG